MWWLICGGYTVGVGPALDFSVFMCICWMLRSGAGVVHRSGAPAIQGDVPDKFLTGAARYHSRKKVPNCR